MPKLPPAEKLPLAARKNIRDEWETKKADLESQLTTLLGVDWTVDINPLAIYPYGAEGSYGKTSPGNCIFAYVEGAIYRLKYFVESFSDSDGVTELNTIASAHVLTLDVDESGKFSYCGCDISPSGQLRILFNEKNLGTNINDALDQNVLLTALNTSPTAPADEPLTLRTRIGIRQDYDSKIAEIQKKFTTILSSDKIKLSPNFESCAAALRAEQKRKGSSLRDDWEQNLGRFAFLYFEALASHLEYEKFGDDEMLSEGFNEAVSTGEIAFRIVDKLEFDSYCEVKVAEDGVLYLQATPSSWGTNVSYVGAKLVDQL